MKKSFFLFLWVVFYPLVAFAVPPSIPGGGSVDLSAPGEIGGGTPGVVNATTVNYVELNSTAADGTHGVNTPNTVALTSSPLVSTLTYDGANAMWKVGNGSSWTTSPTIMLSSRNLQHFGWAISDETTDLTTGTAKVTDHMPCTFTVTGVRGSLATAATGGTLLQIDVNDSGTTIFSTELTFDAGERTTEGPNAGTTATTPAVISDTAIAKNAALTIDIVAVGSTTTGKGAKVWLDGYCAD